MTFEGNKFFCCDALILLERLPSEAVTLAYLDPPWHATPDSQLKGAESGNFSDEGYTSYFFKTVQQLRRILKHEGSLFVHLSPISPLDVRLVINQVFAEQPKYEITWPRRTVGGHAKKAPAVDNDFILVYSQADTPIYNPVFRPLSNDEKSAYRLSDVRGSFRLMALTAPFDRPALQYSWRGYRPPAKRSWRYTPEKLEALALDDRIYFPSNGGMPTLKHYLDDHPGVELGMIWDDIPSQIPQNERTGYPNQTPVALMDRIIQIGSNEGDLIIDPFCGSGTTLIAAQSLRRNWWGADNSEPAQKVAVDRLTTACGLTKNLHFSVLTEAEIMEYPSVNLPYMDIVASVSEIAKIQKEVIYLTDHLLSLKRRMNIGEDDEEGVEMAIAQMQDWITTSIANQQKTAENYIDVVCAWLTGWDRLDKASQSFLPQAELLFDCISRTKGEDYSPFIIQYCRALENELLTKLFAIYTDDFHSRHSDGDAFLANDISQKKTSEFAKAVQKRDGAYTLGNMNFIMCLMKDGGQTLQKSPLLKDFRSFAIRYFSERIVDKAYLVQIERINKDFRCKAAHPHVLDAEVALRCRDQVRSCLNNLILNYKGGT